MAQSTILAPGTTYATSGDVIVSAGSTVTVGLFVAAGGIADTDRAAVMLATPGADLVVALLTAQRPAMQVAGPATFRIVRELCIATIGIFAVT